MSSTRTALVTGAGSGIGRAVAIRLASAGLRVGLLARSASSVQAVGDKIIAAQGHALSLVADVTRSDQVTAAVGALTAQFGPVTVLVNNAGSGRSAPFDRMPDALWDDMLAVNLTSVYRVTQAVLPHMLAATWGRIVNVASVAGLKGYPYISAYAAAKHGVVGLTRSLAVELAGNGITVNAVCPGYVDTPMTQRTLTNIVDRTGRPAADIRRDIERISPQRRMFDADEIAATIVHLCSDDARGINGQALPICGGELNGG